MSNEKSAPPPEPAPVDGPSTSPPEASSGPSAADSSTAELDEASRTYYEALAQRITETYARFTDKDMELLKALGWG